MPVINVMFTAGELFQSMLADANKISDEILALADVNARPLNPGEKPEDRYHQIAKLGKKLAEFFKAIDKLVTDVEEARRAHAEAHGHVEPPPGEEPDNSKAN